MMKRTAFALICIFFVLGRADGRTAQAKTTDVLSEFRFLIGAWKPVTDPSKPPKYAELITYAPIHDGKFLVSQQILREQGGEIIYKDFAVFGIDPDSHLLFLHAYNTDGSIDRTHEIDSPPGQ